MVTKRESTRLAIQCFVPSNVLNASMEDRSQGTIQSPKLLARIQMCESVLVNSRGAHCTEPHVRNRATTLTQTFCYRTPASDCWTEDCCSLNLVLNVCSFHVLDSTLNFMFSKCFSLFNQISIFGVIPSCTCPYVICSYNSCLGYLFSSILEWF